MAVRYVLFEALVLALGVTACSSDSNEGGAGSGGHAGSAGSAGAGGHAATGGSAGSGGRGGTGSGGSGGGGTTGANSGCPLFSSDDAWNADVSGASVDAMRTAQLAALVGTAKIHPDFGPGFGIPINVVPANQPAVLVTFDQYADESDPGPYAFPSSNDARVEGTSDPANCDGDCHLITVQQGTCTLFEGYACHYDGGWVCGNGAKWDLTKRSYGQRPEGWTSVDAAGLPVYAGLARYEEFKSGEIKHAIRFTVKCTTDSHVPPATHDAVPGGCDPSSGPPMGQRVRLKADFDISSFSSDAQVFLRAFKKYGMILADNGSNFFFQSEDHPDWPDGIDELKQVPANAFEAVTP